VDLNHFIANIGGQITLLNYSCTWRRVLGKTYGGGGYSEMFKLEDNSIFVYNRFSHTSEILRDEYLSAVSQPVKEIIPKPFTGLLPPEEN